MLHVVVSLNRTALIVSVLYIGELFSILVFAAEDNMFS